LLLLLLLLQAAVNSWIAGIISGNRKPNPTWDEWSQSPETKLFIQGRLADLVAQ
jgi:hypothetical protein